MQVTTNDIRQFTFRLLTIVGCGMLMGFVFWRSGIFIPTHMSFQYTTISVSAGLAYALLKRTSILNSFLVLFCWVIFLTILEDINNRWMYVLNFTYTAGIASVLYLFVLLVDKGILSQSLRRMIALPLAIGIVNPLHVLVLVLMVRGLTWIDKPLYVEELLETCVFNLKTGLLVGIAIAVAIESVDYSFVRRASTAVKSWALDANGS